MATDDEVTARGWRRRSAIRLLSSRRALALMGVVLAIGCGVAVAAQRLTYAVLLDPLPYAHPEGLVYVWDELDTPGMRLVGPGLATALRTSTAFASVTEFERLQLELERGAGQPPGEVAVGRVSVEFLRTLGVQPVAGRGFEPDDAALAISPPILVSRRLAAILGAVQVGDVVRLSEVSYRVIGIMPDTFWFPDRETLAWTPIIDVPVTLIGSSGVMTVHRGMLARLPSGVGVTQARAALSTVRQSASQRLVLASADDLVRGPWRPAVFAVDVAAGLLLLLTCVNVGWQYAVSMRRRRSTFELLGALGVPVSGVLRLHAVAAGVLVAVALPLAVFMTTGVLRGAQAVDASLALTDIGHQRLAPLFASAGITVLIATGLCCVPGIVVSLVSLRGNVSLRGPLRTNRIVIAAQVGLLFGVSASAVYCALLLARVMTANVGIPNPRFVVIRVDAGRRAPDPGLLAVRLDGMLRQAAALGVQAGSTSALPLTNGGLIMTFEPRVSRTQERPFVRMRVVSPSYFAITGLHPVAGRLLDGRDRGNGYAVVSERFGQVMRVDGPLLGARVGGNRQWTVSGVVPSVRQMTIDQAAEPEVYTLFDDFAALQPDTAGRALTGLYVIAVPSPDAATVRGLLLRLIAAELPEFTVRETTTFDALMARTLVAPRLVRFASNVFAFVALVVVVFGVHAAAADEFVTHERDMAVRAALGATPRRLARETAWPIVTSACLGIAAGALLVAAAPRVLAALVPRPPDMIFPSPVGSSSVVAVVLVGIICASTGAALLRVLRRVVRTPNVLLGPLPR